MDIAYTLSVTVRRPVRCTDHDDTTQSVAEWMVGKDAIREMEREVLQALKKLDADCDVEVMETARETTQAEDDAQRGADEGDER